MKSQTLFKLDRESEQSARFPFTYETKGKDMIEVENVFDVESLFGEESPRQIAQMVLEEDKDIWNVRESALIPVINRIQEVLEEYGLELDNETFTELKSLYQYGKGYHYQTSEERKHRWNAYARFAYELAKQGKLSENLDLTRDADF